MSHNFHLGRSIAVLNCHDINHLRKAIRDVLRFPAKEANLEECLGSKDDKSISQSLHVCQHTLYTADPFQERDPHLRRTRMLRTALPGLHSPQSLTNKKMKDHKLFLLANVV